MLEMLPFKPINLLANRKSKLKILNLLLHITNDSLEAFSNFSKKNYFLFDAQVGEARCQIRAYKICYLAHDNSFNESVRKILTNLVKYKMFILKFIDIQHNNLSFPYIKLLDSKQLLKDFIYTNNLNFPLSNNERFLILAFFLNKYNIIDVDSHPIAINYQYIKNNFGISTTSAKNLATYYQSCLSELSCKYILDLLKYYTVNDSNKILLKLMLKIGDEERYVLPYYNEFKVLLCNTKTINLPILLIINSENKDNQTQNYLLYKQNLITGEFNLQSEVKYYKSPEACIVFKASTNLEYNTIQNLDQYLSEYFGYSIKDALILNAAAHPQYTGETLASVNQNPYETVAVTNFYLLELVKKMNLELVRNMQLAYTQGFSKNNRKILVIKHIYCNLICNETRAMPKKILKAPIMKSKIIKKKDIMLEKLAFEDKEAIEKSDDFVAYVPGNIYWKDVNGYYLGCNDAMALSIGLDNRDDIIALKDSDIPWQLDSEMIRSNDLEIITTGKCIIIEENLKINDKNLVWLSRKEPLRNKTGEIIGVICTALDITTQKEKELKAQNIAINMLTKQIKIKADRKVKNIKDYFENILSIVPGHVYWKNLNGEFLGCNTLQATDAGFASIHEVVGLTDYDMPWKDDADALRRVDLEVVTANKTIIVEEKSTLANGKNTVWLSRKEPLKNNYGQIIGVVGTSVDITDRKEKEQMIIDSQRQQAITEVQEEFRKIVGQMLHDLQSPLSSLSTIIEEQSSVLPENSRITLRNAKNRIDDITKNLFNEYEHTDLLKQENLNLLVSLALLQIIGEKRYEYNKATITFESSIEKKANFAFIKINPSDFKRMISNLINNAIEAFKDKPDGKVTIKLRIIEDHVVIFIHDNGGGMPKHIRDKFYEGITVTEGKEKGQGLGLRHVRETMDRYGGKCKIFIKENESTEIMLKFLQITSPHYIASEIILNLDDTVVILDDDESIHGGWDTKFAPLTKVFSALKIKHFTEGIDAINYINTLSGTQKESIFLLTDYELLNQGMNGMDIIKNTQMNRAILVTSHASSLKVQKEVVEAGVKTLPKELVHAAIIKIDKKIPKWSNKVGMVWIEDQKCFVDDMVREYYGHLKVDVYYDPESFLADVHQYPLDTRFILDTYYYAEDNTPYHLDGFALAEKLYNLGYTNLVLFAGEIVKPEHKPHYLTVILKNDLVNRKILDKV